MIVNNFDNAIMQVNSNIQDIESLDNILDILQNQDDISSSDIDTYNKLYEKVERNMVIIQDLIQKTVANFDSISYQCPKRTQTALNRYKKVFSTEIPNASANSVSSSKEKKSTSNLIKKDFDANSSDLLCFFPKDESENLVISTVQDNYEISFNQNQATIYIQDEDFHISINTVGVQFSNLNSNNILYVSREEPKYKILTNNQIEIPDFIQISKISRKEDFLEVELTADQICLSIQDNIIFFKQANAESTVKPVATKKSSEEAPKEVKPTVEDKKEEPAKVSEEVKVEEKKEPEPPQISDDQITDNDTLFISDTDQKVTLPYTVKELEAKMKKNKNYKSLQDVINGEYTIPLETFKNPVRSRFKEAFQLIKKKEHGSLKEAIGLGFELMFQSDLNPAIIAACKDLDELDIYLDCLDDNELDKFSCFKIQYNVKPLKNPSKK